MKRSQARREVRVASDVELRQKVQEMEEQLVRLRCQASVEGVKQPHLFRALRRGRARVLTEVRRRALERAH